MVFFFCCSRPFSNVVLVMLEMLPLLQHHFFDVAADVV